MKESLLDIVFEEDEVIFRNILGYRTGQRRKTTDIWGRDRHVVYCDEFGHVVSSAREIRPLFGGTPYVEFYDKDKQPRGRAYVTEEILSGRRKVEYTNNEGKTISTRYVDEDKVLRNNAVSMEASNSLVKQTGTADAFRITTPIIACCVVFLTIGLSALLSFLDTHIYTIIRYGRAISVYGICPLMVLLQLLLCRGGKASGGLRLFRLVHLVVFAAGVAMLAYMTDCLFLGRDFPFLARFADSGLGGLLSFLVCFAPTLVLGLVSGLCTVLGRKRAGHQQRAAISCCSMNLMQLGNLVLIFASMGTMVFADAYGSGGVSGVVGTVVLLGFMGLLLALSWGIAWLPYKLLSGKF